MSRARFWSVEILLWAGAALGAVSLLIALASVTGLARPLVVTSGSMEPELSAGSLALARPVAASDLAIGDVVNVTRSDGMEVTHRVVGIAPAGDASTLTLKGDANPVADASTYTVERAHRVVGHVPWVGWAVVFLAKNWLAWLVVLVGAAVLAWRSRGARRSRGSTPDDGHHEGARRGPRRLRGSHAATSLAVAGLAAVTVVPTQAAFTDDSTVTSGTVTAVTASSPSVASNPCSFVNSVFLTSTVTIRWNGVTATGSPPSSAYEYVVTLHDRSTNDVIWSDDFPHGGGNGAVHGVSFDRFRLQSWLNLDLQTLLLGRQFRLEVRSRIQGTDWMGTGVVTQNFSVPPGFFVSYNCT